MGDPGYHLWRMFVARPVRNNPDRELPRAKRQLPEPEPETKMPGMTRTAQMRALAKWSACAFVLLAPGSFVILPLLWLARLWAARHAGSAAALERRSAGAPLTQSPRIA